MTSNNIKNQEELIKELNLYNGILSDSVIQYLNSLIESKISVIRNNENISDVQRRILSEIDVYKDIAIYNIRKRAETIFRAQKEYGKFIGNRDYYSTHLSGNELVLFWLYEQKKDFKDIPEGYKTSQIGKIRLYKTIWGEEERILEIDRIKKKLSELHTEYENMNDDSYMKRYILPNDIQKYESILTELENRNKPNEEQKQAIELTSRIHDLFLSDYGLSSSDFEESQKERERRFGDDFMQEYKKASKMEKMLVKRVPNLTIESHITYL